MGIQLCFIHVSYGFHVKGGRMICFSIISIEEKYTIRSPPNTLPKTRHLEGTAKSSVTLYMALGREKWISKHCIIKEMMELLYKIFHNCYVENIITKVSHHYSGKKMDLHTTGSYYWKTHSNGGACKEVSAPHLNPLHLTRAREEMTQWERKLAL